ncbi:MAG: bifunctional diaminohydroxyphosphoribosylaminopyrimidine deaminase/5-amino-6-(5-phosphoribosylamino)uracil reductase RibD [Epsilonproteobacteria bacterium]|nr:bifunctional diaminohydroxyphosphoribosylaminopyrimidine deaminase/5-amino-6-(5-phosphoribosylamino)uracil reductase RibD [Campylobacterota bacterium]NPA64121.1 bifunctional diaminohydroxyphosphoribosylaminopyrimidine deaminase/5-amino-6-(5-phosphoribosylamino)uracil reductase RibD [Campylobacterota bacterium]
MVDIDSFYMQAALRVAWRYQGLTYPNPAVGAVVLQEGRLLSIAAHKEAGAPHAEVLALKEAYYRLSGDERILQIQDALALHEYLLHRAKSFLKGCEIYVTLEPCAHWGKTPSCASLLKDLGIRRVVIATRDPNPLAGGGADLLKGVMEVKIGVCEKEARDLLEPFALWSKKRFVFFKYAQTLNANLTQGTISSLASRRYVHRLRSKIDLLVIGGNTVRIDRPLLDCRLAGGRAPDVLIVSKRGLKREAPLFEVPKRRVFVEDSLERIKEYRYVMIEGGEGMLRSTQDLVDWYLIFLAPKSFEADNYKLQASFEFLHQRRIDEDILIWSRHG